MPIRTSARALAASLVMLWPALVTTAGAQPTGGTAVDFPTRDALGRSLVLHGQLWVPASPARGAVVIVHGSGGWSDHREGHYGRALSAAGYAALAIDAFGPRGISQTTEDQSQVSSMQMARDSYAARRFLLEQGFEPSRTAVFGFSKGGAAALFAADRTFLREETERFPVAVAFYPACNTRPRTAKPASAVFMALAEKDDYSGVKPCQDLADAYTRAAGEMTVVVYPGASHAFDGNPAGTAMMRLRSVENYMDCLVIVEEDGSMSYLDKHYAPTDSSLMADMRRTCVRKGASIWTHPRQKEAATRDVIDFLNRRLAR